MLIPLMSPPPISVSEGEVSRRRFVCGAESGLLAFVHT